MEFSLVAVAPKPLAEFPVKNRTRTEITIETERVLIIRKRKGLVLAWCSTCAQQVPMVKVDEAATIARVSSRTLYR